jgi:nuclear GTP-binding protein
VIEASDVLLEVLDARDPLGSRCAQVEEAIVQSEHKKQVLVLNRSGTKGELGELAKLLEERISNSGIQSFNSSEEQNEGTEKSCSIQK